MRVKRHSSQSRIRLSKQHTRTLTVIAIFFSGLTALVLALPAHPSPLDQPIGLALFVLTIGCCLWLLSFVAFRLAYLARDLQAKIQAANDSVNFAQAGIKFMMKLIDMQSMIRASEIDAQQIRDILLQDLAELRPLAISEESQFLVMELERILYRSQAP